MFNWLSNQIKIKSVTKEQIDRVMSFADDMYKSFCDANELPCPGCSHYIEQKEKGLCVVTMGEGVYDVRTFEEYTKDVQKLYKVSDTVMIDIMNNYNSVTHPVSIARVERREKERKPLTDFINR